MHANALTSRAPSGSRVRLARGTDDRDLLQLPAPGAARAAPRSICRHLSTLIAIARGRVPFLVRINANP
jgi:hypothetical protein